jgi:hypothetical protein
MGRNFAQLTLIILYIDGFFVKKNVVWNTRAGGNSTVYAQK